MPHPRNDRDLKRLRAALPDNFVLDDHRRTGVGRIEGADPYVASVAALLAEAPEALTEDLYYVAVDRHGWVAVGRWFGTLASGGAFESIFVRLLLFEGDRMVAAELFELEDLDRARARFEELRPDPTPAPPKPSRTVKGRKPGGRAGRPRPRGAPRTLQHDDGLPRMTVPSAAARSAMTRASAMGAGSAWAR